MPASLYPELDEARRFWSRVEKRGSCWIWTGAKNPRGYGHFGRNGRTIYAHRYVYELAHGSIPPGLYVCHVCDVPSCVNPEHLFAGTPAENLADCSRKGRKGGNGSGITKLSEADVRAIFNSTGTHAEVARRYGVSHTTIYRIRNGHRWGHLKLNRQSA